MDEVIIKKVSVKVKKFGVATIQNFLNLTNLELIDRTIAEVKTESVGKGDYRGVYPIGLKVKAEAHSYGVAYAEDIMFVTLKLRNERKRLILFRNKNILFLKLPG